MMLRRLNQKNASAPEDLVKELSSLRYEHPERTQTIKQILRDGHTSCWGVSRLALNRLRKAGLDPESVFIYEDEVPMLPTHQFTTYRDGDKFRVHDNFGQDGGIGPAFDTREEAIDERVARWRKHENHFNPVQVYTGTRLPKPGIDNPEYIYRIMKLLKHLKTYPKMEKESSLGILAQHANIISKLKRNLLTDS